MNWNPRRLPAWALAFVGVTLGGGFSTGVCDTKVTSRWRDRAVTIDGQNQEWDGALQTLPGEKIDLGLLNDDQYLYASLFVGDRQRQAQILTSGCTLWLDVTGKEQKKLGIHYPLGLAAEDRRGFGRAFMSGEDPDSVVAKSGALKGAPEIVSGPEAMSRPADGVEVAVKPYKDSLAYEIKVPLKLLVDANGVPAAGPGKKISLGVEIPVPARPEGGRMHAEGGGEGGEEGGHRGGGGGGGGGWHGGGHGGHGGGGPGGGGWKPPQPLNAWVSATLSKAP